MSPSGKRSLLGWNLCEYLLMRLVVALGNLLTVEQTTALARVSANLIFACLPKRRKVAFENIGVAFPDMPVKERKALAWESFRNLCTSLMEFFRTPSTLATAPERFEIEGRVHLDEGFRKGKGIVFAVSHLGSWEYLAFLPFLKGYPFSVIVRDTRNPYIHRWIDSLRKKMKLTAFSRHQAAKKVLRELKANRLVSVLIDQWASREGIWAEFFGKATSTTSLPARLAAHTGSAIIPGYCIRKGPGQYKIIVCPEVTLAEGEDWEMKTTRALNQQLEAMIRRWPAQWTWTHRRWKSYDQYTQQPEQGKKSAQMQALI